MPAAKAAAPPTNTVPAAVAAALVAAVAAVCVMPVMAVACAALVVVAALIAWGDMALKLAIPNELILLFPPCGSGQAPSLRGCSQLLGKFANCCLELIWINTVSLLVLDSSIYARGGQCWDY